MPEAAEEIKIDCKYSELVDTDKLVPNPKNPNTHPENQITKLALLIKYHGWRHPIIVSNRSGFIVCGHARLMAAKELKLKTVPVDYQDFENEAQEYAIMISDNVVQELSEINGLQMAEILNELDALNYNLDLTALDKMQIDDYILGPTNEKDDNNINDDLPDCMTFVVTPEQREIIENKLDEQEGENRTEQLICLIKKI